jgi:hypothetical protein
MPNTFDLITTQTLASTTQTINITLPTNYTDIQISLSLRSDRGSGTAGDGLEMYFNNDTTSSNYNRKEIFDETSTIGGEYNLASLQIGVLPAAASTANLYNNGYVYLPQYAGSGTKIYDSSNGFSIVGGPARFLWKSSGYWNSTNPITTVSFRPANGSLVSGSKVTIYGIKKY